MTRYISQSQRQNNSICKMNGIGEEYGRKSSKTEQKDERVRKTWKADGKLSLLLWCVEKLVCNWSKKKVVTKRKRYLYTHQYKREKEKTHIKEGDGKVSGKHRK